jgi:cell division control protein 6
MLEVNGFVLLSISQMKGREKGLASIALASGVRPEELIRGLFVAEGASHDEVKGLWDGELNRIRKLSAAKPAQTGEAMFGATQDD